MRNLSTLITFLTVFSYFLLAKNFPAKSNIDMRAILQSNIAVTLITNGNFLVVGTFSYQKNAENFVKYLNKRSTMASLGYYKGNGRFYVYILESGDLEMVRRKRDELRLKEEFRDAWVLKVGKDFASRISNTGTEVILPKTDVAEAIKFNSNVPIVDQSEEERKVKQYKVYLNTIEATTFKEIPATVKMISGEPAKVIASYGSNGTQIVEIPIDQKQEVQFVCEVFGYRKVQQDLNFKNPVNESSKSFTKVVNDTIILDFELVRYKKGEVFTLFNVFFYNDATIMLPKSTFELNELVRMVKENENLIIKLHGHTNGNQYGKIIKLEPNSKNYFDLKPSNLQAKGSAKELSFERANIIKKYLMEQGIEEKRIEVKGWGGAKTLYPTKSPEAKKNVRVEIEILRD